MKKLLFILLLFVSYISFSQTQTQQGNGYYIIDGDTCTDVIPASFKGGRLLLWLNNNLRFPAEAFKKYIAVGYVYIQFTVNEDGSVCCPEIYISTNPVFNEEAIRVVMRMPKWIPARACGKAVKMKFTLPINFRL